VGSYNENKRVQEKESGDQGTGGRGQKSVVENQIPDPRTQTPVLKSYKDLEVWQKAIDLVVDCYQITKDFPKNEVFGLAGQLQRAAVSVPANIAEGRARQHTKEFIQHVSITYGSLAELETHVQIAERLNYIDKSQANALLDKATVIGRMLNGLRRSLEKKRNEVQND
jgi:four helix bundle protein